MEVKTENPGFSEGQKKPDRENLEKFKQVISLKK